MGTHESPDRGQTQETERQYKSAAPPKKGLCKHKWLSPWRNWNCRTGFGTHASGHSGTCVRVDKNYESISKQVIIHTYTYIYIYRYITYMRGYASMHIWRHGMCARFSMTACNTLQVIHYTDAGCLKNRTLSKPNMLFQCSRVCPVLKSETSRSRPSYSDADLLRGHLQPVHCLTCPSVLVWLQR